METGKEVKITIETDGEITKLYVNDKKVTACGLNIKAVPGKIRIEIEKIVTDEEGKILLNEEVKHPLRTKVVLIDTF